MSRFNCNDCVMFGTNACRFGTNHRDYSAYCKDILVEQNHAYNKAIDDFEYACVQLIKEEQDTRYGYLDGMDIREIAKELKDMKYYSR